MKKIKEQLLTAKYDFLREHPDIKGKIILLMVGGAHAYGVATADSDIDLRGITIEDPEEIYGLVEKDFFVDKETDTVLYRLQKAVQLLLKNNPNMLEILCCDDQHLLHLSPEGKLLRDNAYLFLSANVVKAFGGYANDQLKRAKNGLLMAANADANEKEQDMIKNLNKMMLHLQEKYKLPEQGLRLYLAPSERADLEEEIHMDFNLLHYPLRDFVAINSELNNAVRQYGKLNHRNREKTKENIFKHLSHLVRVLITGIEILEEKKVQIFREKEKDLLLGIKVGQYALEDIFTLVDELEERFHYAKQNHSLPPKPDYEGINEVLVNIYRSHFK